jgi:hypothetical protein
MKKSVLTMLGVLGVLAASPMAHATLLLPTLSPGATKTPTPNTAQNNSGAPLGTLVVSTGVESLAESNGGSTAHLTVSFEEEVYRELSGSLDFYYQISVTAATATVPPNPAVEELDVFNYSDWSVGAGTASSVTSLFGGAGTQAPGSVSRDSGAGDTITFSFSPDNLQNGTTSYAMVVSTPATNYVAGDASLGNSQGVTGQSYTAYSPAVDAVPEPMSLLLGGSVLSLSALWIRRRRNAGKA